MDNIIKEKGKIEEKVKRKLNGEVIIRVMVIEENGKINMNYDELSIENVKIKEDSNGKGLYVNEKYDSVNNLWVLSIDKNDVDEEERKLKENKEYVIKKNYIGKKRDEMYGL